MVVEAPIATSATPVRKNPARRGSPLFALREARSRMIEPASEPKPIAARDRTENARAGVEVLLHQRRHHEGNRRRGEQPRENHQPHHRGQAALAEDVAEGLGDGTADPGGHCAGRPGGRQQRERDENAQETRRVGTEDPGGTRRGQEETRDRRSNEARRLKRQAVDRHRALEIAVGDRAGEHGLKRREAERPEAAADHREGPEQPYGQRSRRVGDGEHEGERHVQRLQDDEELSPVVTICEGACRQGEDEVRNRVEKPDEAESRRRSAEQKHDVPVRRSFYPATDQGDQDARRVAPEQAPSGEPRRRDRSASAPPPRPPLPRARLPRRSALRPLPAPHTPRTPGLSASAPHGRSSPRVVSRTRARSASPARARRAGPESRPERSGSTPRPLRQDRHAA